MTATAAVVAPRAERVCQKGVLSLAGAGALLLAFACPAHAAFGYRKQLTVNAGLVVTGPIADFPVLVSITDPVNLKTVANGGHVANGADFQFRGEDVGTCNGPASCRLDFEIERYDGATGTLVAWVRVSPGSTMAAPSTSRTETPASGARSRAGPRCGTRRTGRSSTSAKPVIPRTRPRTASPR